MYMNWSNVLDSFGRVGLPARIVPPPLDSGSDIRAQVDRDRKRLGLVVAVEVDRGREIFSLYPTRRARPIVLEASARRRHLLLLLKHGAADRRILFGHDERHLFSSILPGIGGAVFRIDQAFEALKPREVRDAESRPIPLFRGRARNPIRQGEWFFVPEPEFVPQHWMFHSSSGLRRPGKRGWLGHAHVADETARFTDGDGMTHTYVRGAVHHPEHETIHLDVWHRIYLNLEEGKPYGLGSAGRAYLD